MDNQIPQYETVSKFDRIRGNLHEVALFAKPTTIKTVQNLTGKAETFVIETCRHEDNGDYVFLEHVDENGVTRIVLPPKVVATIARQSESLAKRNRSRRAKAAMKARMDSGEKPGAALIAFREKKKLSK